jgi:hypothetical protein
VVTPTPRREQRLQTAGHQALIKPLPLRPAVLGGYTLDDFTVDGPAGAVTCRAGVTPADQQVLGRGLRGGLPRLTAAGSVHDRRQGQDRAAAQARPVAAWLTPTGRHCGVPSRLPAAPADGRAIDRVADPRQPQAPIRGVANNDVWLHHRIAALNLRRILALGLTRRNGVWVLA